MSAEPSDRQASAVDAAIERTTAVLRGIHEQELAHQREVFDVAIAEAVREEREAIAKMLDEMQTEWRPTPGEKCRPVPEVRTQRVGHGNPGGTTIIPTSEPHWLEVDALKRAAARIRARK